MPLARAINHAHSAASYFLQDFVIADPPLCVPHFVFGEDRLERFARCLAVIRKSLPQRAAQAKAIAQPRSCAALPALGRAFTHGRDRIRQAWGDHVLTTNAHQRTRSHKSDVGGQRFVFISVHSWLRCRLSAGGQRRAQMSNFVFYVVRIFDGLRDFLPNEPAITTPQIVKLFFYCRLCDPKSRSQTLIRNICAVRGKIKAQRLKQSEPAAALTFLAQTPKRLFDYCSSPAQIEQLLGRPRIERLRRDRQL